MPTLCNKRLLKVKPAKLNNAELFKSRQYNNNVRIT